MLVGNRHWRTVWHDPADAASVWIIEQRALPFRLETLRLASVEDTARAISDMSVRGAGCIGATAAWGMYLAAREAAGDARKLAALASRLVATRPTAVNLAWAVHRMLRVMEDAADPVETARREAGKICEEDVAACAAIGRHGLDLIRGIAAKKPPGAPVNILTHCNAGWLAFVDIGSATAPIYAAHAAGIPVHVWVDETRPRNQGARLTAWELAGAGVPHTLIADNAGGHLMQRGLVDMVITGADRVTRSGDVANKIGTYLKALAAHDNGVPFYVALPESTFDFSLDDGLAEIPIEERDPAEVLEIAGFSDSTNSERSVRLTGGGTPAANPAFDITPARLVTAIITGAGICPATEQGIGALTGRTAKV